MSDTERLDLSPREIIMLARLFTFVPELAVVLMPDENKAELFTEQEDFKSLADKVEAALKLPSVKAVIDSWAKPR